MPGQDTQKGCPGGWVHRVLERQMKWSYLEMQGEADGFLGCRILDLAGDSTASPFVGLFYSFFKMS